jgi:hypothetical protein
MPRCRSPSQNHHSTPKFDHSMGMTLLPGTSPATIPHVSLAKSANLPIIPAAPPPIPNSFPLFPQPPLSALRPTAPDFSLTKPYFPVLWIPRRAPFHPQPTSSTHSPLTRHSSLATIFPRNNTYKTLSKQTTLSPFRISIYEKTGGGPAIVNQPQAGRSPGTKWDSHSWLSPVIAFTHPDSRITNSGLRHGSGETDHASRITPYNFAVLPPYMPPSRIQTATQAAPSYCRCSPPSARSGRFQKTTT